MIDFNPKVSIIIPVYNGSNYIHEAIDSAINQSYKNIEIIVINDGSNDDGKTREIVLSFGDKIRYFEKENGGVATALNLGIKKMTGEYFSWLSHDDVYYPNKIEIQINYLKEQNNKDVILFSDFMIKNYIVDTIRPANLKIDKDLNIEELLRLLFSSSIHGCTLLIPRKCFEKIGMFSISLKTTQDYDFNFRLLKNNYKFHYIPDKLILTRHHKEQDTLKFLDFHIKEANELYIMGFDLFSKHFQNFRKEQINEILNTLKNRGLQIAYKYIFEKMNFFYNKSHIEEGKSIIWLYWENKEGQITPEIIEMCWSTIIDRNKNDFCIIITNPDNIMYYLPDLNPDINLFERIAHKADYIRFNLLYKYGGIWLDSDFIAFRSLKSVMDKINKYGFVYTGYKQADGKVFPIIHFLGAKKEHPIFKNLIKNIDKFLSEKIKKGIQPSWDEIGGYALQKLITGDNSFRYESKYFCPIKVYNELGQKNIFYPVKFSKLFVFKKSFGQMLPYSIHHEFFNFMREDILNMKCYISYFFKKTIVKEKYRQKKYQPKKYLKKLKAILKKNIPKKIKKILLLILTFFKLYKKKSKFKI